MIAMYQQQSMPTLDPQQGLEAPLGDQTGISTRSQISTVSNGFTSSISKTKPRVTNKNIKMGKHQT